MSIGPGAIIAIVGPSGVGKDSLIRALEGRMRESDRIVVARRYVTRAADAHEDHDTMDEAEFLAAERAGRFALSWSAHGLRYGVPIEVDAAISRGDTVVCNVSRASVAALRARYRRALVVLVTARPETLASRLAARGRESQEKRQGRLARGGALETAFVPDLMLDNDGLLEEAAERLYQFVTGHRGAPESRYAIYLAPPPDSELWRFGSLVIGRDAASGEMVPGFAPEGFEADSWRAMTTEPRRYGFHATIKAPFRLAPSVDREEPQARISSLARRLPPFDAGELRVSTLAAGAGRGFVALTLTKRSEPLARLEALLVRELDDLRAPMTAAERERRAPERLSERQWSYLDAWGYPYVLDEFRLHFTLTNAVAEPERIAAALRREFERRVSPPRLIVDALALFVEKRPGDDFQILHRAALTSSVEA